jgi:hypothetical protein
MNPWAFIAIAVGILVIIIGIKGTQHVIAGVITGRSSGSTPQTQTGSAGSALQHPALYD